MDYNIENKGFVCWVYNFQRTRRPWSALFGLCVILLAGWFFCPVLDPLGASFRAVLVMIAIGAAIAMIEPRSFAVKLIAYIFIFLGVIFGLSYSKDGAMFSLENLSFPFGLPLNEWLPSVFAPNSGEVSGALTTIGFIGFALIGAIFLVMILSWFVYNARSSEINQI